MKNKFTIKYGKGVLKLRKSPQLIGLALRTGRFPARSVGATGGLLPASDAPVGRLGGFDLHAVPAPEMDRCLDCLRQDAAVEKGTHVWYAGDDDSPLVPNGEIFVRWDEDATAQQRNAVVAEYQLVVIETRGPRDTIFEVSKRSPNPLKVVEALQLLDIVEVAEPDLDAGSQPHAFAFPNDEAFRRQWHLRNTGEIDGNTDGLLRGADARVAAAWRETGSLGSPAVVVAVLDDGFDLDHPDLQGAGKIVAPWDFVTNTPDVSPRARLVHDQPEGDWHGTACAAVAVGNAFNGGVVGAAPACSLMPLRRGRGLADRDIERCFDYAAAHGAWVVSCSWGPESPRYGLSTRKREAIARCARNGRGGKGIAVVFAAGNAEKDLGGERKSTNGFATHPDVICVAASTSRDERAHYSNFGKAVFISAPSSGARGRRIVTADVRGRVTLENQRTFQRGNSPGDLWERFGGTSSSAPLVAGICGLLFSEDPELTVENLKAALRETARPLRPSARAVPGENDREFGHGCVNALAAIRLVRARRRPGQGGGTP